MKMRSFKKLTAILVAALMLVAVTGCSFVNRGAAFLRKVTAAHNDAVVDSSGTRKFYYDQLSEAEQHDYRLLLAAYQRMDEEVRGLTLSVKQMIRLNKLLLLDCPELFWVANSGVYYDEDFAPFLYMGGRYVPRYRYTREQVVDLSARIDAVCDEFAERHKYDDDYTKALSAYEYIIDTTDYDTETAEIIISKSDYNPLEDDSQCIVSVFVEHNSVCAGYSAAYQYLLRRMGIFSTSIIGTVKNADTGTVYNHEWSLVELDGEYYYSDITWGEPDSDLQDANAEHSYFCITSGEMNETHSPNDWAEYPDTDAVACNYFYREGGYLEELDMERIGKYLLDTVASRTEYLVLKFAAKRDYAAVKEYLQYNTGKAVMMSRQLRFLAANYDYLVLPKTTYSASDSIRIIRIHFTYDNGEEE